MGDEVIVGVPVGIATKATDGTSVGVGDDDAGVAVPIKADP